jgi:hypothetical protein
MHDHDHDHDHAHDHAHRRETYADQPHTQHVVLELGDGIGALIVHTDPALLGTEVEISRAGEDERRQHKEVLERVADGRSTYALVYDNLAEGDYTLWIDGVAWARDVHVASGEIAELDRRDVGEHALPAF